MANLKKSDLKLIKNFVAYPRGRGFVLDYSNVTFAELFKHEFGIDIDDKKFTEKGTSKGNRLLCFCEKGHDVLVATVLRRLFNEREAIKKTGLIKSNDGLEGEFIDLITRLEKSTINDDLETWLENQPHEVMSIFSARAAMRAVPAFVTLFENGELQQSIIDSIILPSLWAMATALSVVNHSGSIARTLGIDVIELAYAAHSTAYAANDIVSSDITDSAAAAVSVALNIVRDSLSIVSTHAATVINDVFEIELLQEYILDRNFINSGKSAQDLAYAPLWLSSPDDIPDTPLAQIIGKWHALRSHLLSVDKGWEVWTDWYEARLRGEPLIKEIEIGDLENGQYGRVTLPLEYYQDAEKANEAIREIIGDYHDSFERPVSDDTVETPPQNPASIKPVIRNGKIYLSDKPLDADLEISLAIENMLALRDEFEDFITSIENDEGNFDQRPIDFMKTITALMAEGLPDSRTYLG